MQEPSKAEQLRYEHNKGAPPPERLAFCVLQVPRHLGLKHI